MLSMNVMSSGQDNYYLNLAQEGYYLNGGEPNGFWYGAGTVPLKLTGVVKPKDLRAIMRGYSPSGVALVQNPLKKGKQKSDKGSLHNDTVQYQVPNGKPKSKRKEKKRDQ